MILSPFLFHRSPPEIQLSPSFWPESEFLRALFFNDFAAAIKITSLLCLLAAVVILIAGLIQLKSSSRRTGVWNLAFGGMLFAAGLFMEFHNWGIPYHEEILRGLA